MYHVLLLDQWKAVRLPIGLACIIGFTIPVLSVQLASTDLGIGWAPRLLTSQIQWGTVYPLLAAGIGLLLGTSAWSRDHRADHVYAMSLPVPRWQYALLKCGAGMLLVLPAVLAVFAGAVAASVSAPLPDGLTAYPVSLTVRFGLTSAMAFAIFFAIASGTARTAGIVLGSAAVIAVSLLFLSTIGLEDAVVRPIMAALFGSLSPLNAFGGRWMLIDV